MIERLLIALVLTILGITIFVGLRRIHLWRTSRATPAVGKPLILYFRSNTCAPCETQGRFLQQLQAEFGDRVLVEKVDANADHATAERYGVFTVPTTLIVDPQGTVRHANYGLADARKLAGQVRSLGASVTS